VVTLSNDSTIVFSVGDELVVVLVAVVVVVDDDDDNTFAVVVLFVAFATTVDDTFANVDDNVEAGVGNGIRVVIETEEIEGV